MSDEDQTDSKKIIIIDRIIRELTDQPGMVVYRDAIAEKLGIDELDVSSAIRRFKNNTRTDIAKDIQIVVPARAWRYVPNAQVARALRAQDEVKTPPLTVSIRAYFENHPHRVIYLDELTDAMSTTDEPLEPRKVYVGINNAKLTDTAFKNNLQTVVSGRAWQYVPNDGEPPAVADPAPATPTPATPTPKRASVPPPAAPAKSTASDDNEVMLFEKLADLPDGAMLVRDENKEVFRLTRV